MTMLDESSQPWQATGMTNNTKWIVSMVTAGLGVIEWEGVAVSVVDAVTAWSRATGRGTPPRDAFGDLRDVNGDGSRFEMWLGWGEDDPRLTVERVA